MPVRLAVKYPRAVAAPRARRPYVLALAVWAAWLFAVLAVVVEGVRSGAIADPINNWAHFGGSLWPLFIWDFTWYRQVAVFGYAHGHIGPEYAFFPLWPLVIRATGTVPDWIGPFVVVIPASAAAFAGVVASNPGERSWRSAAVLACWPASFLLMMGYPDVVALAAAAWAAALALRGHPWLAGVLGGVAAFARPPGFLIALPLALVVRSSLAGRIFAAAVPVGVAAGVQIFLWIRSDDPLAFVHAQQLPYFARNGPGRLKHWPGHLVDALQTHSLLIAVGAVLGIAVVFAVYRRFGRWPAIGAAYVAIAAGLLLGAQATQTRIESAVLGVTVPVLALLWSWGGRYRPWALFATAVIALSVFSGSVTSFPRQALFAFPLFWAVADGPRPLRHPLVALGAIAANVAYALTLARYAP